jgi:hypothetical protein
MHGEDPPTNSETSSGGAPGISYGLLVSGSGTTKPSGSGST